MRICGVDAHTPQNQRFFDGSGDHYALNAIMRIVHDATNEGSLYWKLTVPARIFWYVRCSMLYVLKCYSITSTWHPGTDMTCFDVTFRNKRPKAVS